MRNTRPSELRSSASFNYPEPIPERSASPVTQSGSARPGSLSADDRWLGTNLPPTSRRLGASDHRAWSAFWLRTREEPPNRFSPDVLVAVLYDAPDRLFSASRPSDGGGRGPVRSRRSSRRGACRVRCWCAERPRTCLSPWDADEWTFRNRRVERLFVLAMAL